MKHIAIIVAALLPALTGCTIPVPMDAEEKQQERQQQSCGSCEDFFTDEAMTFEQVCAEQQPAVNAVSQCAQGCQQTAQSQEQFDQCINGSCAAQINACVNGAGGAGSGGAGPGAGGPPGTAPGCSPCRAFLEGTAQYEQLCPDAQQALSTLDSCAQQSCGSACNESQDACVQCIQGSCGAPLQACIDG